jgi:hypothetical protein
MNVKFFDANGLSGILWQRIYLKFSGAMNLEKKGPNDGLRS